MPRIIWRPLRPMALGVKASSAGDLSEIESIRSLDLPSPMCRYKHRYNRLLHRLPTFRLARWLRFHVDSGGSLEITLWNMLSSLGHPLCTEGTKRRVSLVRPRLLPSRFGIRLLRRGALELVLIF